MANPPQLLGVTADAEVGIVPRQHLTELLVLLRQRLMPHRATRLVNRLDRTRQAILSRMLPHHPVAFPGLPPEMEEPQEDERRILRCSCLVGRRLPRSEVQQSGLVRV